MSISRLMQMGAAGQISGAVEAEAIDFDGTNDYLLVNPLSGASDSKQFTLSFYCYFLGGQDSNILTFNDRSNSYFEIATDGKIKCNLRDTQSTPKTCFEINRNKSVPFNTWFNLLISIDLTSTGKRHVFLNDEDITSEIEFLDYENQFIEFSDSEYVIAGEGFGTPSASFDGRLSHVYLDYTYRDLSVEANRRLFVDYDETGGLVPASGQASLSPILYVPMDDPDDPGRNDGTGGDFTLNGTVAQSGRGPNQYNAPASTFDGANDYVRRTSLSGLSSSKQFTLSMIAKPTKSASSGTGSFEVRTGGSNGSALIIDFITTEGGPRVYAKKQDNTEIMSFVGTDSGFPLNSYGSIQMSVDLSDPSKRAVFVNGIKAVDSDFSLFVDDFIGFASNSPVNVGGFGSSPTGDFGGELSDIWFDTTYIDLSASNPFYDSDTGKPKYLGENGELPTGTAPLIYLPLRADNAGANKGTGGDFTVNSGPLVGARGPSEFWADSAEFNGTDQYLSRSSALAGISDSKAISFAAVFRKVTDTQNTVILRLEDGSGIYRFQVGLGDGNDISLAAYDGSSNILSATASNVVNTDTWHLLLVSFDLSNVSNRAVYIDNVLQSTTWGTYTDALIDLSASNNNGIGAYPDGSIPFDGKIGFLWFNTEYIDFSQEANRLKFFDAFGYPVDVGEDGSKPTGNQPLVYMNNDFHLGTNLGSGGDFTPANGPSDGGHVKG